MRPNHFYCEVYRMNFYYCLGWSRGEIEKYMKDRHKIDTTFDRVQGRVIFNKEESIIIIWTLKKKDISTLVHECVHAASFTLESRGVLISHLNDEAMAYLVEAIFRKAR